MAVFAFAVVAVPLASSQSLTGTWTGPYQYVGECLNFRGEETLVLVDQNGAITGTVADVAISPTTGHASGTVSGTLAGSSLTLEYAYVGAPRGHLSATVSGDVITGRITGICGSGAEVTLFRQGRPFTLTLSLERASTNPTTPDQQSGPELVRVTAELIGADVGAKQLRFTTTPNTAAGHDHFGLPPFPAAVGSMFGSFGYQIPVPHFGFVWSPTDVCTVQHVADLPSGLQRGTCEISLLAPEVSGTYDVKAEMAGMPGVSDSASLDVRVDGLVPLASGPNEFWVLTGQPGVQTCTNRFVNSRHSLNHHATPRLRRHLHGIATLFHVATEGLKIRINDISLPNGGLFDTHNNWLPTPGHNAHRLGHNADIELRASRDNGTCVDMSLQGSLDTVDLVQIIKLVTGRDPLIHGVPGTSGGNHIHLQQSLNP